MVYRGVSIFEYSCGIEWNLSERPDRYMKNIESKVMFWTQKKTSTA